MAKKQTKPKKSGARHASDSNAAAMMGRSRFANVDGYSFRGRRDMYQALGYDRQLTVTQFRARFRRGGVAGRIVEVRPEDTWRSGAEIVEDANVEKSTKLEIAFEALDERLKIWSVFERADILAGIGRYSIIVLGGPGDMETPLVRCSDKELLYLSVYAEDDASIAEFETNTKDPRYGKPRFYQIRRQQTSAQNQVTMSRRVHWSRVLHVADGILDDEVYGTPRLERPWNRLDDLEKVLGGGSEAFWKRADQGQQFNLDPTMELSEEQITAMEAEVEAYVNKLTRVMRTRGMEINSLGSDVADFKNPAEAIMAQLAAITGIPQRILMGSEQAKLAAEQDSARYYQGIEARRTKFAEARVVRPFIARLMELGTLPKPKKNYTVVWSQIRTKDDAEKASLAKDWADLNQKNGRTVVTENEIRQHCLGLPPLSEVVDDELGNQINESTPAPQPFGGRQLTGKESQPWSNVHRAADRFRRTLQKQVDAAFNAGRTALDRERLITALQMHDEVSVMMRVSDAIIATEKALLPDLEETLGKTLDASGTATAKTLNRAVIKTKKAALRAAQDFAFDKTNPKALAWIRAHAGETIEGISQTTRNDIRELVEEAFVEQFSVDDLADEIEDLIGDKDRAEEIARTETMRASNEGQEQAWNQAVEEGVLTGRELKEWIVTPDDRLCPICEPMDTQKVALNADFRLEDGTRVDNPPAHPRCRCTTALSIETA